MATSPMQTDGPSAGQEGGRRDEARESSPSKKQKAEDAGGLTLEMIREAMRAELGRDREELGQTIAQVSQRVDGIEAGVTKQMETTNKLLQIVTTNHDKQTDAVSQLKSEQERQAMFLKEFRGGQEELEQRLALLENKFKGSSLNGGSTADTEAPKRPALIMGGWPDDQASSDTLQKAKDILRQLEVPLDYSEIFVPGLKRGYAIIPIPQKWGETEDQRRETVQQTLQKVRHANVMLGVNPAGGHRKLWMSLSQSPERRRKSRLAGKVKRAMLEMGAQLAKLEVEFSTGSVWYNSERLSSATLETPQQAERAGAGWVRLDMMAKTLGKPLGEVQDSVLSRIHIFLFQEVITDVGLFFDSRYKWTLIYGKREGAWRGEGILYHSSLGLHHNSKTHTHAVSTTIRNHRSQTRMKLIAAHLPHHATTEQTAALAAEWGEHMPRNKVWMGIDANETFTTTPGGAPQAHSSRGEELLHALSTWKLGMPPQSIATPTFHPYNTAMQSRRLDYLWQKGYRAEEGGVHVCRHQASSDHDAVWAIVAFAPEPQHQRTQWGPRRLAGDFQSTLDRNPPTTCGDPLHDLRLLAQALTVPGGGADRFHESPQLRAQRRAAHKLPQGGAAARAAWKSISRARKQEQRAWQSSTIHKASQMDWRAKRSLDQLGGRSGWEHHLLDDIHWQHKLITHFRSIFHKVPQHTTAHHLAAIRTALTIACKHHTWRPFGEEELLEATATWHRGKSTGPDGISLEALKVLLQDPEWSTRLTYLFNDFLYRGARELRVAINDILTTIPQSNGVRQGSPDSPVLFAAIIATALDDVLGRTSSHLPPKGGPNPPQAGGAFMDDTYLWSHDRDHLQRTLAELEVRLAKDGLAIHPGKTAIIYSEPEGAGDFQIGGERVDCLPFGTEITALGSPLTFLEPVAAITTAMNHRARKAFGKHSKLLCARTPIKARIKMHTTLVRNAALWASQSWPIVETLHKAVNSTQLRHIRTMMGDHRQPGETWVEWNTRSLRRARVQLHQSGEPRWSTFLLAQTWGLYGHMARSTQGGAEMLQWKNLKWWRQQQHIPPSWGGIRHGHRFNSDADPERQIVAIGGLDWMQVAQNRQAWQDLTQTFVERFDVPWATGKQGSIGNIAPIRGRSTRPAPPVKRKLRAGGGSTALPAAP
ncbi:unnamed protein product [Symbiodinium sp. CCMP2592]|nr:unnamed protein product [Symbiodinium sp. CCMP2592]